MIDVEPLILEQLERLVPAPGTAGLDWREIERRAGVARPRRRRVLTTALLLAVLFVAVAFARSLGGFSGWLTGEPGNPAPTSAQQAFERSIRAWAGFPKGTQLRQLAQRTVGGATYSLDGFRGAGSLCLRLIVTGSQSANELACPPLSQLRGSDAPAIVVAADYGVGHGKKPASPPPVPFYGNTPAALVTVGIVADGVQRVEVAYSDGTTAQAAVSGDAFLAVANQPSMSDRLTHVWAIAGGKRVAVPFVLQPTPFEWPAATAPALSAHGPARVQRVIHGGTIGWLARRQPVGVPVPKNVHDIVGTSKTVLFAREITPDPAAPERIVVSTLPTPPHAFGGHLLDKREVCAEVVGGRYRGGGCWPAGRLFSTAPFSWSTETDGNGQYVTLAGLASDDVTRLTLYLGTGQTEAVPLHDNGYLIEAPIVDYPLRLVADDARDLVIGVVTLHAQTRPVGTKPPAQPVANAHWHQVLDNGAGTVSVAPSTGGGTCYAIRLKSRHGSVGGGSLSCPPALPADGIDFGASWSRSSGATIEIRTGKRIAEVVVHYKSGNRQTVRPTDGIALAAVPPADDTTGPFHGVGSLTGLDSNGHVVATQNLLSLIGGAGAIAKLSPTSITIGSAVCRITPASPSLAGYTAGIHVQYLCHQGVLTLIGRSKPGRGWNSRTTLSRGPITALNTNSITIENTDAAGPNTPAPNRTCKISMTSPSTRRYHVGEQVQTFCAGGTLTGINRGAD